MLQLAMPLQCQHPFPHNTAMDCTGDVPMSDESRLADGEEGPSSEQAPAKRKRHVGPADPQDQTQAAAVGSVHAAHAESAGSAIQMFQPAVAVRRWWSKRVHRVFPVE